MIEFGQAPVDETQLLALVIDHDVVGLYVSVHDAARVAEIQSLEQFTDIVPYIHIAERLIECPKVRIVDVLEDERRGFALRIPDHIKQSDDIRAAGEILQNFDLSLDLLLLDRFEHLDDTLFVVEDIDAFEDFRILSTT